MPKKINLSFIIILIILLTGGIILLAPKVLKENQSSLPAKQSNQTAVQKEPPIVIAPSNGPVQDLTKKQGLLYFSPNIITIKKGDEFSISLMANTFEQELAGLDAILKYETGKLKFNKVINIPDLNLVFPQDKQENFAFSLLAPADKIFKGEIKVADLYFQALEVGQTKIDFLSQPGSTSDTNLIAVRQGEILKQAEGASVVIE